MKHAQRFSRLEYAIALGASLLALVLALYNAGSNDNHIQVLEKLRETLLSGKHFIGTRLSCWQCYHPKAYHLTIWLFSGVAPRALTLVQVGNLVSFLCWAISCSVITAVIRRRCAPGRLRLSLVALCWTNPSMMTVGVQATTDAMLMMWCVLATFLLVELRPPVRLLGFACAALALLTKGPALSLLPMLALCVYEAFASIKAHQGTKARRLGLLVGLAVLLAGPLLIPEPFAPYREILSQSLQQHRLSGLNVSTVPPQSLPLHSSSCSRERDGFCSYTDGLLTFRFLSLLEVPKYPRASVTTLPAHTASLWTTVWARTVLPVFPQWFWRDESPFMDDLSRVILLASLGILLCGSAGVVLEVHGLITRRIPPISKTTLYLASMLSSAALLVVFALHVPGHASFKEIYLIPAIIPAWHLFGTGALALSRINRRWHRILVGSFFLTASLWVVGMVRVCARLF